MKSLIPVLALVLLVPALAPAASAASGPSPFQPMVCTYEIIESVAVCVSRDTSGRVCATVFLGPSATTRCLDPRAFDTSPVCFTTTSGAEACVGLYGDYLCVNGQWSYHSFEECVYVGGDLASFGLSAKLVCYITQADCVGYLACVYATKATPKVCVPDPCYTTSCWRADAAGLAKCVVIVPEGGDMGEKVCYDPRAECKLWYERTTFIGTTTICLVPPGGEDASSSDAPCMDRYWERSVGPVRVVSRSSCEYQVYVNDEPVLQ